MDWPVLAFAAVLGIAALTYLGLPVSRYRLAATVAFLCLSAGTFAAAIEMLGSPKPSRLEWRPMADFEIIGLEPDQPANLVYVWIRRSDGAPVSYSFPWPKDARELSGTLDRWRRRDATGDQFYLTQGSPDDGPAIRAVAAPPMPAKDAPQ